MGRDQQHIRDLQVALAPAPLDWRYPQIAHGTTDERRMHVGERGGLTESWEHSLLICAGIEAMSACLPFGSLRSRLCRAAVATLIRYYYVMRYTSERSTDPGLLVLTSLAEGPKHGYAITHDVEQLAGVRLGPGTLYGALARLESNGLIEALPAEDRRRPYRLTGKGSAALSEQLQALEYVARSGLARLRVAKALQ